MSKCDIVNSVNKIKLLHDILLKDTLPKRQLAETKLGRKTCSDATLCRNFHDVILICLFAR